MSLTYEQRHWLRHQISEHHKRMVPWGPGCKGCGGPLDSQTAGCDNCNDRARRRRRREAKHAV